MSTNTPVASTWSRVATASGYSQQCAGSDGTSVFYRSTVNTISRYNSDDGIVGLGSESTNFTGWPSIGAGGTANLCPFAYHDSNFYMLCWKPATPSIKLYRYVDDTPTWSNETDWDPIDANKISLGLVQTDAHIIIIGYDNVAHQGWCIWEADPTSGPPFGALIDVGSLDADLDLFNGSLAGNMNFTTGKVWGREWTGATYGYGGAFNWTGSDFTQTESFTSSYQFSTASGVLLFRSDGSFSDDDVTYHTPDTILVPVKTWGTFGWTCGVDGTDTGDLYYLIDGQWQAIDDYDVNWSATDTIPVQIFQLDNGETLMWAYNGNTVSHEIYKRDDNLEAAQNLTYSLIDSQGGIPGAIV